MNIAYSQMNFGDSQVKVEHSQVNFEDSQLTDEDSQVNFGDSQIIVEDSQLIKTNLQKRARSKRANLRN